MPIYRMIVAKIFFTMKATILDTHGRVKRYLIFSLVKIFFWFEVIFLSERRQPPPQTLVTHIERHLSDDASTSYATGWRLEKVTTICRRERTTFLLWITRWPKAWNNNSNNNNNNNNNNSNAFKCSLIFLLPMFLKSVSVAKVLILPITWGKFWI